MSGAVFAGEPSKTVALAETPTAVQKTIQAQVNDGTLGDIDKTSNVWEVAYDVELTAKDGQERDFTVAEDGILLSGEVTLCETPASVQKAINPFLNKDVLESIDKIFDNGETNYDVELTAKDGRERDFTIADDGTFLSRKMALGETPDVVQKAIKAQMNDGKLGDIDENFGEAETNYDVEMTAKDGREKAFTLAADGSLSSVRVTLAEIPPPARRTVKNQIGDGEILRIDKSYVKEKGVSPYKVQGSKNGGAFDFSVGPRGRFLGMDD